MSQEASMVHARIELDLEGLRAACATLLVERQETIQSMVAAQLDAQLQSGNIERLITAQIEREVRDQLEAAIKSGVSRAFWDARDKITQLIVGGIAARDQA